MLDKYFGNRQDWDLSGRIRDLEEDMSRMLNVAVGQVGEIRKGADWVPAVDLVDTDDSLQLVADLPGVDKKDLDIWVKENVLTIEGTRDGVEAPETAAQRKERPTGKFHRSLKLSAPVNAEGTKAFFADGVLTLTLPKMEEAKPRRIQIDIGS